MATVKGINRTKADSPTAANILSGGMLGGNVKVMIEQYELSSTPSGDIIQLGKRLPKGAKVVEVVMGYDALGSSTTIKVGDAEDDDRYITAVSTASAGFTRMNAVAGFMYETDESETTLDTELIATLGGATASGTLQVYVFYTHE